MTHKSAISGDTVLTAHPNEFALGWKIILAAALGVGVGLTGLPFYSFGVFVHPLEQSQGWSRLAITSGMLFLSLGSIVTGPFLGSVVDRWGARVVALPSLVGLALGFVALSQVGGSIGAFYVAWIALALLGCGTTPLTWSRAVTLHFERHRGLALGFALLGTGIASAVGPPLLQWLIGLHGWRAGYFSIAVFVLCVALPIAWFGLPRGQASASSERSGPLLGLDWREAVLSTTFARIAGSIFLVILAQSSATVHLIPLLEDRGITAADAAKAAGALGFSIIVGRILVGWLVDRWHARIIAATFFSLPALAMLLLALRTDMASATLAAVLLGLAAGAEVDLLAFFISRYFGLRRYGTIYGIALSIFAIGAALGAPLTSLTVAASGGYQLALAGGAAIFLCGAALILTLGPYRFAATAASGTGEQGQA